MTPEVSDWGTWGTCPCTNVHGHWISVCDRIKKKREQTSNGIYMHKDELHDKIKNDKNLIYNLRVTYVSRN